VPTDAGYTDLREQEKIYSRRCNCRYGLSKFTDLNGAKRFCRPAPYADPHRSTDPSPKFHHPQRTPARQTPRNSLPPRCRLRLAFTVMMAKDWRRSAYDRRRQRVSLRHHGHLYRNSGPDRHDAEWLAGCWQLLPYSPARGRLLLPRSSR